jgi:hypothetical protein
MATTIRTRIYARGEVSFAKFLFLPSWFAKLLEANFSCFAKIIWMPSWFAKLLELLLLCVVILCQFKDGKSTFYKAEYLQLIPLKLCSMK